MIGHEMSREAILAPLEIAGDLRTRVNISVRVRGGGYSGQASAVATAISRALTGWTNREDLRKRISVYDKYLISGDARMKEPKKFGGPGARRRKQKSYR
ncbi:30S ribosomal protein S9 [Geodia barretti]|uniref:Small ribosomal subunit protein uS9 n=1 Tax=Geodia barretti TaxID=519541 RepID=A0AA35T7K0_GEOBA|nr:30S ribosomal protein S9 [Geodia barretti]